MFDDLRPHLIELRKTFGNLGIVHCPVFAFVGIWDLTQTGFIRPLAKRFFLLGR